MSRIATRVHVDAADIARLEALVPRLQQDLRVQVTLDDGSRVLGIVGATPTLQMFFDPGGREGMNAVVRIDTADGASRSLWLDQIRAVSALPNPSPPEASRAVPADPNAPTTQ